MENNLTPEEAIWDMRAIKRIVDGKWMGASNILGTVDQILDRVPEPEPVEPEPFAKQTGFIRIYSPDMKMFTAGIGVKRPDCRWRYWSLTGLSPFEEGIQKGSWVVPLTVTCPPIKTPSKSWEQRVDELLNDIGTAVPVDEAVALLREARKAKP